MKNLNLILIFLFCLLHNGHLFEINELDSKLIDAFFNKGSSGARIINLSISNTPSNSPIDAKLTIPAIFEEQCAIECLRNLFCTQYLFSSDRQNCILTIKSNINRHVKLDITTNQKIANTIGCDLLKCSKGLYCFQEAFSSDESTCLCDTYSSNGATCSSKIVYETSEWSSWSNCSADCNGGFRTRARKCLKKYFDSKNQLVNEELNGFDWLCSNNSKSIENYQMEICNSNKCVIYDEWSEWTPCSKICGGSKTRKRACKLDSNHKLCDSKYLNEIEYCSVLDDCSTTLIKLENTEKNSVKNITKKGNLIFLNTVTKKEFRIYTQTDSSVQVSNIGKIACLEFGFNRSVITIPKLLENMQIKNDNNIYGLICSGKESSIKECQAFYDPKINNLYELEVECLYNGYWSVWSAWTQCSVTCGAGAKTRLRTCTDPAPSTSDVPNSNGANCASNHIDFENCVMQRCSNPKV